MDDIIRMLSVGRNMPAIDEANFVNASPEVKEYVSLICVKGHLRASKPKPTVKDGKATYVWRNVAFYLSNRGEHQCLPILADWYLKGTFDERRATTKHLDTIVSDIVDRCKIGPNSGAARWARALGVV